MNIDEITARLLPGFIVQTCFKNTNSFNYNIILSIYRETFVLTSSKYSNNLIGQKIIIKSNIPPAEYVFTAEILDISDTDPQTVKVRINDCTKYNEQRRYERFLSRLGSNIKAKHDKIGVFSLIYNISFTGACVESPLDIPVNELIKLDILPKTHEDVLSASALICRKSLYNDKFIYGLTFENNSPAAIERIQNIIESGSNFKLQLYEQWQKNNSTLDKHCFSGIKILIADDIKLARNHIKSVLDDYGFNNIEEASNGSEVIEKIQTFGPDIITMDISMPGIDGIETIRHLSDSFPLDRIVIISSDLDDSSRNVLVELGITKFLGKPFNDEQLIAEISNIFPEVKQC